MCFIRAVKLLARGPLLRTNSHGRGLLGVMTRGSHHSEAILDQRDKPTVSELTGHVTPDSVTVRFFCPVTFSSPAATLKANSMTEPTAMRTAADECISFHTVSLSTCRGQHRTRVGG